MEQLKCPNCGSVDLKQVSVTEYQCAFCGTKFVSSLAPSGLVDVLLTQVPGNVDAINVIKAIRSVTRLGLAEAKRAVDHPPALIKQAVSQAEGERIKGILEKAGAQVMLKPA
jgi:ribosomal protein L7/L12